MLIALLARRGTSPPITAFLYTRYRPEVRALVYTPRESRVQHRSHVQSRLRDIEAQRRQRVLDLLIMPRELMPCGVHRRLLTFLQLFQAG